MKLSPLLLIVALANGGCLTAPPSSPRAARLTLPEDLRVQVDGSVSAVGLEQYVLASALAEVSPVGEDAAVAERIFAIQAIIARTYAVSHLDRHRSDGFDLCSTTHCQLYDPQRIATSRFTAVARKAVQQTAGTVLAFSSRPIQALYHADCGGVTAAADQVWGGRPVPYLVMAPDSVSSEAHRPWQVQVDVDRLRTALNLDPRSSVGGRLDAIAVTARDPSGRAAAIRVEGEQVRVVRGDDFRAILNRTLGVRGLQSTRFTVSRAGGTLRFEGTGFGHGVGLCQRGAAARARGGEPVDKILATYFPGTILIRVGG